AALERPGAVVTDAVDEVVGELLGVHVPDPHARVHVAGVVANGVQQVRLAQTGLAVDEQRVVGAGRRLGDRQGGRVGEPVGGAGHEGLEGVLRVEARVHVRTDRVSTALTGARGCGPGARTVPDGTVLQGLTIGL